MDPWPLIYNPASGGGRGRFRFKEAEAKLALRDIQIEAVATEAPGHATTLARELAQAGHKRVLLLGGDGTFSEAANGVMPLPKKQRPAFGILPSGTGNDFLRDFDVEDLDEALDRIEHGKPRPIDAGRYVDASGQTRWSINVFGTGFAAEAADLTNRRLKWIGKQAYNTAVLLKLARLTPTPTKLTIDGKQFDGDYPLVMVCNTVHTGGAMKMAPMAKPDDGWLDVLTLEDATRRELLQLLMRLQEGTHIRHEKVEMRRAKKVKIEPEANSPILADGEVVGQTPVEIEVDAGALRVIL